LRDQLYRAYASQDSGCGGAEAGTLVYHRDIRPVMPSPKKGPVVDIGCGLVSGFCKHALGAETGILRRHIVRQNLTLCTRRAI